MAPEVWHALARNIAPDYAPTRSDPDVVAVPIDRFLARRDWLVELLESHGCDIALDETVVTLLGRGDDERREIDELIASEGRAEEQSGLHAELATTRFRRELRDFQLRDLAKLMSLSHGANFSVPGAGKTTVTYACYEVLRTRGMVDQLLVVSPISAFDAWFSEALDCFDTSPHVVRLVDRAPQSAEVLLINYQRLASRYEEVARWVNRRPTQVVLDEAHRMKRGRGGEWGSRCLDLAHLASRRDLLTGTPAPQHPRDFIALLDYLWPSQSFRILPSAVRQQDPPARVMGQVSRSIAPFFVRTTKNELGLRQPQLQVELVTMGPIQTRIYEALRSRMRWAVNSSPRERATFGQLGEVVMYLLEAGTNPALLSAAIANVPQDDLAWPPVPIDPGSTLSEQVLAYPRIEMPTKFQKIAEMVRRNAEQNRKTLVWSNFVGNLQQLATRVLPQFEPALIYGAVPSDPEGGDGSREHELRRFREDDQSLVLLANPAAMSEGVSLHTVCHDAIYVDRTFNGGQYLQSLDRIHRLGLRLTDETRITFLVARGTIDEAVNERVRVKAERLSQMLADPDLVTMALPDEEAFGEWVDPEDLDCLFDHLRRD